MAVPSSCLRSSRSNTIYCLDHTCPGCIHHPMNIPRIPAGLTFFSFLALLPGFFFRPHYFILLLPAAAFGMAVAVATIDRRLRQWLPRDLAQSIAMAVFIGLVGFYALQEHLYLTSVSPRDLSRLRYGPNPFIEAVEIAKYLQEHNK